MPILALETHSSPPSEKLGEMENLSTISSLQQITFVVIPEKLGKMENLFTITSL